MCSNANDGRVANGGGGGGGNDDSGDDDDGGGSGGGGKGEEVNTIDNCDSNYDGSGDAAAAHV